MVRPQLPRQLPQLLSAGPTPTSNGPKGEYSSQYGIGRPDARAEKNEKEVRFGIILRSVKSAIVGCGEVIYDH
jgi:hypothetical protein